jgi:hypothetical protein
MTDAEIRWTSYISKDLDGFTPATIKAYIEGQANSVCRNLGLPLMYEEAVNNPLKKILYDHISIVKEGVKRRTAFFEGNVADYSKSSLVDDL